VLLNETPHHLNAARVLNYVDRHPACTQKIFLSTESDILTNHYSKNAIEEDCPRAHGTRRQGRVQDTPRVDFRRKSACVLQGIHLSMQDHATLLYTSVMATTNNPAVVDQNGAYGNPALGQTDGSFGNGRIQILINL
jgi:hypothetical protein